MATATARLVRQYSHAWYRLRHLHGRRTTISPLIVSHLSTIVLPLPPPHSPHPTLVSNIVGSVLIAALPVLIAALLSMSEIDVPIVSNIAPHFLKLPVDPTTATVAGFLEQQWGTFNTVKLRWIMDEVSC